MAVLPKSRVIKVEFQIALPVSATEDEVEEWIHMECGHAGSISMNNPLINHSPEILGELLLTDTWRHLHSEAIDNHDGSFTIRRWTDVQPMYGKTGKEVAFESSMIRARSPSPPKEKP